MKKFFIILICALMLVGCDSNSPTSSNSSVSNGNNTDSKNTSYTASYTKSSDSKTASPSGQTNDSRTKTTESGTTYYADKLPFSCPYNDKKFSIKRMEYYTDKIGKSYELFAIIVLDIKEIPSDELDYFIEDTHDSLFTLIYFTNDDNNFDFDSMTPIGMYRYKDTKELLYIYMTPLTSADNRYPFDECELHIRFSAKQKEKYEYKSTIDGTMKKLNKSNKISYDESITKTNIKSLDSANSGLKSFIVKQVNSIGDYYAGLVGK